MNKFIVKPNKSVKEIIGLDKSYKKRLISLGVLRHGTDEEYKDILEDLKSDLIKDYFHENKVINLINEKGVFFTFLNDIYGCNSFLERREISYAEQDRRDIEDYLVHENHIVDGSCAIEESVITKRNANYWISSKHAYRKSLYY